MLVRPSATKRLVAQRPLLFTMRLRSLRQFLGLSKRIFLENAMLDRSPGLRQYMQVHATVPLRARLNGHTVVAGLPVPTDDLIPVAGGPS